MNRGAIVILCAGSSSRLGFPKALVRWNNSTLIETTAKICLQVTGVDVYVVTGCHHKEILPYLTDQIKVIYNPDWASGMGRSISVAVEKIKDADYNYIIITLVDQPKISSDHLNELIQTFYISGKGIITSFYKGISGPPVLFFKKYYPELMELDGDYGAKPIVRKYHEDVERLEFEGMHIDIDTLDDLKSLS